MAKIPDKNNMTTEEILAHCRAEDSSGAAGETADAGNETPQPAATEPAKPAPTGKPKSTKDILAAARAGASKAPAAAAKNPGQPPGQPPTPKAKPTSTKDILAAARAAKSGATGKATAKPPVAAAAKKAAPADSPSGEKPSVQQMLAAFRTERQPATEQALTAGTPLKLPIPPRKAKVKPAPAAVDEERRSFLVSIMVLPSALNSAWTMLAASTVAWTLAFVRFALPNVLVEPPSRFKIGSASDYDFGTVSTKWKALRGIWVVHTDRYQGKNVIVALSTVCTHLGCTPNWLEGEQKFKCPCHGSGFYVDGINFEGPAPRPLERHGISVAADGMLEVDKSLKFQEEMGQWEDPKSFVAS